MRKKAIWIVSGVIIFMILAQCIYIFANQSNPHGDLLGQIVKKYKIDRDAKNSQLYAKAGNIEIFQDDIDYFRDMSALGEEPLDEKAIVKKIVTDRLLLGEAEKAKVFVTDEEVNRNIDELRKNMPHDTQGYDQFLQMIKNIGWTEEEYWEKSRGVYQNSMTIGKYKNQHLKTLFKEQHSELSASDLEQQFKEYYANYKEELFNACLIQYSN